MHNTVILSERSHHFNLYRIAILESIIANISTLDDCNGFRAIPLIQVILMLTTDLNGNNERDQKILNDLLTALVNYIGMDSNANASKVKQSKFGIVTEYYLIRNCLLR